MHMVNFGRLALVAVLTICCIGCQGGTKVASELEIVTIENSQHKGVLITPAKTVGFPLSPEVKAVIAGMKKKFADDKMAGLAAPQVGHSLRVILFHVREDFKMYRDDIHEIVPLTVLINPSYSVIEESGTSNDWEACFSVELTRGKVDRYNSIDYQGYDINGNEIKGVAHGFLARLLQHEIDHTNGILFTSRLKPHNLQGPVEEMMKIRMQEIEERKRSQSGGDISK